MTAEALAADAAACAAAGAFAVHLHPRDADGAESLDPATVDAVARTVRAAGGIPVGVTTGAWIIPDPAERLALIARWTAPDFASVNLGEEGAVDVMRALLEAGIGIEAGLATGEDAEALVASGLGGQVLRCLVEPYGEEGVDAAFAHAAAIHDALDAGGVTAPRLQHSDGDAAWPILRDALAHGHETRIGFEDVLVGPAGEAVAGNAALVAAVSSPIR